MKLLITHQKNKYFITLIKILQGYIQEYIQSNSKSISIVIPAYNEEKRIKPVLEEICHYIKSNKVPWNIIVSIDGTDGTENVVKELIENNPFLKYIKGKGRGGKGAAIKKAIELSSGEFTLLMDADGSISLKDIVKFTDYLTIHDVILFDRYSLEKNLIPLHRRIPSRGFNILVKVMLGVRAEDTQCGYKIVKTEYLRAAFEKISFSNAFFDVAMIYYLKKSGANIKEIPVEYKHSDASKFSVLGLVLGQGISLFGFRLRNSPFWKYVPKNIVRLYYRKFRWI